MRVVSALGFGALMLCACTGRSAPSSGAVILAEPTAGSAMRMSARGQHACAAPDMVGCRQVLNGEDPAMLCDYLRRCLAQRPADEWVLSRVESCGPPGRALQLAADHGPRSVLVMTALGHQGDVAAQASYLFLAQAGTFCLVDQVLDPGPIDAVGTFDLRWGQEEQRLYVEANRSGSEAGGPECNRSAFEVVPGRFRRVAQRSVKDPC